LFYYFSADTGWADRDGPILNDEARAGGRLALEGAELEEPMSDKVDALMRRNERRKRSEKIGRYMREVPEAPCDYQYGWQKTSFPHCNGVHESFGQGDPAPFLINNGGWVDIFAIMEWDGSMKVLKTKRYRHDFTDRNFDRYRRDALAMERLTSAPNVLNIYGFCGVTAVVDYADGGDIENYVNDLLDKYDNEMGLKDRESSPEYEQIQVKKLRIATQVLTSIATMHNFDKEGQASISHTDISPYQFIALGDGKFVLNDFNRARWITWNKRDDVPCGFRVANNPGKWRAPEEYKYEVEDEKIDVYSAGNVLYYLLTEKKPFDDEDQKDAKKMVMKGKRPPLPKRFRDGSAHRVDQVLLKAMEWCWTHDPAERPSARAVADLLEEELRSMEKKQKSGE